MPALPNSILRLLYREPSEETQRYKAVRREVLAHIEDQDWAWQDVRRDAREALQALKDGDLPEGDSEIIAYYRSVCERFLKRGYTKEDLAEGFDRVQAHASYEVHEEEEN